MIALLPIILDILIKIVGFIFQKIEDKNKAEAALVTLFKSLAKTDADAAEMRKRYQSVRDKMNHFP